MENEINLSKEQINSFISALKNESSSEEVSQDTLKASLTQGQREALAQVMADPQRLKKILASPGAQKLMQLLSGDKRE